MGGFVNEDEATRDAIPIVGIYEKWLGGAELEAADIIHPDHFIFLVAVKRIDIQLIQNVLDHATHLAGRMLEGVFSALLQRF